MSTLAMSTLGGGPADKAGNVHEALWGVTAMNMVLAGQAEAIRIEEPGTDGAEFYLEIGGTHEHWQAKRQVSSQKDWSLQLLQAEGVLAFFRKCIDANERCVFASISDAPSLRGLAANATAAIDWNEFEEQFIKTKKWNNEFKELQSLLGYATEAETFQFLRKVRFHGAYEPTIEALLLPTFQAKFTGPPHTVLSLLRDFYLTSIHKRLTAKDILTHLESHNIRERTFQIQTQTIDFLEGITKSYVAGQRANLIQSKSIPREISAKYVEEIKSSTRSLDILLTSAAGGGKSAALYQIVTGLIEGGIPVLAFRLDRCSPAASTQALGHDLRLPESPAIVLSKCYPGKPVVLVIDQLDFVSATSGRHPDFFEVVAALAEEVRGLRNAGTIHLVMACRKFDFENDNRIRKLLPKGESPMLVGNFSEAEVRTVIVESGGNPSAFSTHQLELLKLPQNLSLLTESGLATANSPSFVTPKELFDRYWECKRQAVIKRCPNDATQWSKLLGKLTLEMSTRQELSVRKTRLDEFSPDFIAAMTSEGVLHLENGQYGFSHESFFDYCYARTVAGSGEDFVSILENDRQALFRRAQLRAVLVYLRDDDFPRYIKSISLALASKQIRPHLKLLVLELVVDFPEVHEKERNQELETLMPYIEREFSTRRITGAKGAIVSADQATDKIGARAWAAFLDSDTFFMAADRLGYISQWLKTEEAWLGKHMSYYLRCRAATHGDRIAQLLNGLIDKDTNWNERLRSMMEIVDLSHSRPLFEFLLRLLKLGILDDNDNKQSISERSSTFWTALHGIAKHQPAWHAEAAAHWLERQIERNRSGVLNELEFHTQLDDRSGGKDLIESAKNAPAMFLDCVVPAVLKVAELFPDESEEGLIQDGIWSIRFRGHYMRLEEAYPVACENAISLIGEKEPESLRPHIDRLKKSRSYVANQFLLSAYQASPEFFAEEAMKLFASEPERLDCGFANASCWTARTVIEKCSLHCSEACYQSLEAVILSFSPSHELESAHQHQGYSAYTLASALPISRRSAEAVSKIAAWQDQFGPITEPPADVIQDYLTSPIAKEDAAKMSDSEWLEAISKYDHDRRLLENGYRETGGAPELARILQKFTREEPDRFAHLALKIPIDAHVTYFTNILYGLAEGGDDALRIKVVQRVYGFANNGCVTAALDVLATIESIDLPEDTLEFIQQMATTHQQSDPDDGEGQDLATRGLNSVRGRAVDTMGRLIGSKGSYIKKFEPTLQAIVRDQNLAVRARAAKAVLSVAVHNLPLALELFKQLLNGADRLLAVAAVETFVGRCLRKAPNDLRPVIEKMLVDQNDKANQAGGRLACLAGLYHHALDDLSEKALTGNPACRLGASQVAGECFIRPECQTWCIAALHRCFRDETKSVRLEAARCFWHLWQRPEVSLTEHNELIRSFLESPAFADDPSFLLHALEDNQHRVPEAILDVCETFITKCSEEARDIRTSLAGDEITIGKLVFRAYAQLEDQPLQDRALQLVDDMCLEGLHSAKTHLQEFER